jgi:hypothetical protein
MTSTADVRSIADVVAELRRILVCELRGAKTHPGHMAAWLVVSEASGMVWQARDIDDDTPAMVRATYAGEHYAAATIIRKVADAYGVSNFREGVDDGDQG